MIKVDLSMCLQYATIFFEKWNLRMAAAIARFLMSTTFLMHTVEYFCKCMITTLRRLHLCILSIAVCMVGYSFILPSLTRTLLNLSSLL